jgi:hypothetical protein
MADYNSSLPIRTENDGDAVVKVADATIPSQQLTVNADGSVNITDNGGEITVDATDLDIRDLSSASDSVEVLQDTHDDLNANVNIQVGDVDVSNGNPVPVSDAGGSLTVDATDLDIRDLAFATDKVDVSGSTNIGLDAATLAALESITVQNGSGASAVNIQDGGNSLTVDAIDLDIRDLTHVSDSIKVGDGTDLLAVNTDGSINVVVQEDVGVEVVHFDTAAAVASGATSNHDRVFASASKLHQVLASASSKLKIEVQIETGSATGVFNSVAVAFNSTSDNNINIHLAKFAVIPAGARVRVIRTNRDNQAQDVYSTIVAIEG